MCETEAFHQARHRTSGCFLSRRGRQRSRCLISLIKSQKSVFTQVASSYANSRLIGTKESFCMMKKVQLLHCFRTPIVAFTLEPLSIMYVSLEPTLGVKGYNVSTSTLLGDHGSVRSSKKPKFALKYGLNHSLEHT